MTDEETEPKYEYHPVTEGAFIRCVRCGTIFGAEERDDDSIGFGVNATYGPVRDADTGTEYEAVVAIPDDSYPAHPECYRELDTERKSASNHALDEFTTQS